MIFNELISVILPVYNGEKYLRESIDSVLAQTYDNWELLILDDCSTDSTQFIAEEYVSMDQRIRYYRNETNLKLPRNLNRGFQLAKGNYLTWTSDDNRYRPDALKTMYLSLFNSDAEFAYASCRIIDTDGVEFEYIMVDENRREAIVGTNIVGACFLYTRKVYDTIGEYDPKYTLVEDFDYWQRIFMRFKTVAINEILYDYRKHNGALTNTMSQKQFNETMELMLKKNISGFGKLNIIQKYYYYEGLYRCRINSKSEDNPYVVPYRFYYVFYFFTRRIPNKIKRMNIMLFKNN